MENERTSPAKIGSAAPFGGASTLTIVEWGESVT